MIELTDRNITTVWDNLRITGKHDTVIMIIRYVHWMNVMRELTRALLRLERTMNSLCH